MKKDFIPALRFKFLTYLFDPFLKVTMKENRIKKEFIDYSGLKKDQKVLDFGCGTGTLIKMILADIPGINIAGLDIDQDILNIAEKKLKAYKRQLIKYNGITILFEDNYFDNVLTSLAIHHIPSEDKVRIFKEIRRVIKPGGKIFILDLTQAV